MEADCSLLVLCRCVSACAIRFQKKSDPDCNGITSETPGANLVSPQPCMDLLFLSNGDRKFAGSLQFHNVNLGKFQADFNDRYHAGIRHYSKLAFNTIHGGN